MRTLYAAADGPELEIGHQRFETDDDRLQVITAPTYGRFIFQPSVFIHDCYIACASEGPMISVGEFGVY